MRLFTIRRLAASLLALAAIVGMLTVGTHALFTDSTANTGNDVDSGELTAPSLSQPTPSGGSVPLSWTAATLPGNASHEDDITYTVERKLGSGSFGSAGGTCTGSLSTTSCTDSLSTSGTYTYRVIAHFRSWTTPSNERSVTVALGAAPAAPTTVALANGGGVGNAYINDANKASLNVDVGLPASSVSTNTVHVTITDGTNTTTDQTTAATNGAGTVTVTGINATSLSDGSVTIQATSSNGSGTSPQTTTSVTKDTVKPTSAAGTVANITSGNTFPVPYTSGDASPSSSLEKVELYVDPPGGGANFALTNTDNSPSASGESFSYSGAAADGTYGFYTRAYDNAGNVEDAPGAADQTATRTTVTTFRMATGSYAGNGANGRAISVGFQPDVVIVKANASSNSVSVMRTSSMTGDVSKPLTGTTGLTADLVESLTATGFTVGTDARVNGASGPTTYHWVAYKAGTDALKVGTYNGEGDASQTVAGLGFQPEYVAVLSAGAHRPFQRFAGGPRAFPFEAQNSLTTSITSLDSDGFSVGADNSVNAGSTAYHYVAFNEVAGSIDVGSYQNSNTNERSISGVGFQPEYVAVRSANTANNREGAHRTAYMPGLESLRYAVGTNISNGILALETDGFRVGSGNNVQESNQPYFYIAVRNTGGGCVAPGTHTLSATADSWVKQDAANDNFGSDSVLKVTSKSGNANTRALVRFQSLLPTLPSGCTLTDATLQMRNKSPVSGRTIEAYGLAASWIETGTGSVTWSNQPAAVGTAATAVTPSSAGFMSWSVTGLVAAGANNGFLLRDQTEGSASSPEQQFEPRDITPVTNTPRLTVTLTG